MQVVGDQAIARALRKERDENNDQQSLTVAWSLNKNGPAIFGVLLLHANGFLDLMELEGAKGVVPITICMILDRPRNC